MEKDPTNHSAIANMYAINTSEDCFMNTSLKIVLADSER